MFTPVFRYFYLYGASITGSIPTEFGEWTQFTKYFRIMSNDMVGPIPTEFGKMSMMQNYWQVCRWVGRCCRPEADPRRRVGPLGTGRCALAKLLCSSLRFCSPGAHADQPERTGGARTLVYYCV